MAFLRYLAECGINKLHLDMARQASNSPRLHQPSRDKRAMAGAHRNTAGKVTNCD